MAERELIPEEIVLVNKNRINLIIFNVIWYTKDLYLIVVGYNMLTSGLHVVFVFYFG